MAKQFVLPAVFTAIDKFSGPVNKMARNSASSMDRMERKFRKVGDSAFNISRKSAAVSAAILGPMALVTNEAVKFEKSMGNISTLVDTNTENMEQMGNEVLALSEKLPVPINELTESLYDIRSAGIPAKDSMKTLEEAAKLSAAGLSTVSEATNIQTSAMNAFASEGLSAAQTADLLFKTVKFGKTNIAELSQAFGATAPIISSAGVKLADFQAATAALTTTGTPASQAQNQLRASVISLQKPTKEMTKVFKELGVESGTELIKKYGDLGTAFTAVNGKINELSINTGKAWGSTEALAGVTALTTTVNESYVNTLEDMTTGTNALDGAFNKQNKTASATMQRMKNNMQSLAVSLGNALIPLLNELMKAVTPVIKSFSSWVKSNPGTVKAIMKVTAVVGGLAAAVSAISGVVGIATKAFGIYRTVMKAGAMATKAATAAQHLLNIVMNANPIALIIGGVIALTAAYGALSYAIGGASSASELAAEVNERAMENTVDLRVETTQLFMMLRKAEKGSQSFNNALQRLEEIQPGIVEQFNLMEGKLKDINAAEKALKASIIERAKAEARAELIKEKIKEAERIKRKGGSGSGVLDFFASGFGPGGKIGSSAIGKKKAKDLEKEADILAQQQVDSELKKSGDGGATNPLASVFNTITSSLKETRELNEVNINVNAPEGTTITGDGGTGVNLSSTRS